MPIVLNGSGTVTGISAGGLPDGCITAAELASGVGGKVLQAVSNTSTTTVNTSGATKSDLLTVTITPASTSNKVLVMAQLTTYTYPTNNAYAGAYIFRGANSDASPAGTTIAQSVTGYSTTNHLYDNYSLKVLDSPNTSSAQVYTLSMARQSHNTNYITTDGYLYHLIAMEIAA
tara:strand:- start:1119 stop:1640 length:522 start_codon:yes stop_codon:yes gene_type:complete